MDETLLRRIVGLFTLALFAFLLSWLLPRPGLERLRGAGERLVTMDLTREDSEPEEWPRAEDIDAAAEEEMAAAMIETPPPGEAAPAPEANAAAPDTATPAPAAQPEAQSAPKPLPPPLAAPLERTSVPKPVVESAPKPAPKPALQGAPAPKSVPKPPAATATPPASGGKVAVQAGAYSHLDKAESVRAQAGLLGVPCFVSPADTAKGTLYRLRCGPFANRAAADAAVAKLKGASIAAAVVSGG